MTKTPEAVSWEAMASRTASLGRARAVLDAVSTWPSRPTTKAASIPRRVRRLSRADWMVAASWVATAARKPKSRASTFAPLSSSRERRAQMRSKTMPLTASSSRTMRSALRATAA